MMRMGCALMVLATLAGCGEPAPSSSPNQAGVAAEAEPVDDGKADCALAGSHDWVHECPVERAGKMLTLRHPDGGFRRFHVLDDGRGLEAADGAEAAKLTILDDKRIEVVAGGDRYRLPAQIGAAGGQ
jgi:predicted small lipoprotein YifL